MTKKTQKSPDCGLPGETYIKWLVAKRINYKRAEDPSQVSSLSENPDKGIYIAHEKLN